MRPVHRHFSSAVLALIFLLSNLGCASRSTVRVYDPYRNDHHRWNRHETVYYNQWVVEDHRDRREYNNLSKDDQRRYWEWRHQRNRR